MASPAWRSFTSSQSSGTGFTATEPASAAQWDLLYWKIGWVGNPTGISTPSGWTEIGSNIGNVTVKLYAVRRGSSAPTLTFPTWTGTFGYSQAMVAVSGATRSGGLYEAIASTGELGAVARNPAAATASTPNTLALEFLWDQIGSGVQDWTPPSGHTLRVGAGISQRIGVASKDLAAAGTEDPGAFTLAVEPPSAPFRCVIFTVIVASELVGTSALTAFAATVGGEPGQGAETFDATGALAGFAASSAGAGAETIDGVGASTAYAASSASVGEETISGTSALTGFAAGLSAAGAVEESVPTTGGSRRRWRFPEFQPVVTPPRQPEIKGHARMVTYPARQEAYGEVAIVGDGMGTGALARLRGRAAIEITGRGRVTGTVPRMFGWDETEELALLGIGEDEMALAIA